MQHVDVDDWDPTDAFGGLGIDYDDIAMRRAREAEIENLKVEEEYRKRLEIVHLQQLEDARLDEACRLQAIQYAANEVRKKLQNEERERKRQDDLLRLPGRLQVIRDSVTSTGLSWPKPLNADKLQISEEEFESAHMNLIFQNYLPYPFLDDDVDVREDPFDHFMSANRRGDFNIFKHLPKLNNSPSLFSNMDRDIPDNAEGKLYKDLCHDLYNALKDGLYAYDINMGRNLDNIYTKELLTFYMHCKWKLYNFTDIEKGWNTLLRLMLILMPHHGDDDSDSVEKFMECIRNVKSFFDLSVNRLTSLRINNTTDDEMTLVINKLIYLFDSRSRSDSQKLYTMLLKREDNIREWFIDYYRTRESREVRGMRYLTLEIIKQCAQYFVEHLANPDVKYLAYIAFGHTSINFQQSKIVWLDKIKEIPGEYLRGNSDLWIKATRLVGATSTGKFFKNYDIY